MSMCSGVGTAEAARAILQATVNESPDTRDPFHMDIQTVALWATRLQSLRTSLGHSLGRVLNFIVLAIIIPMGPRVYVGRS